MCDCGGVSEVVMPKTAERCSAEAHAVDYAGMDESVGNDEVSVTRYCGNYSAVGVISAVEEEGWAAEDSFEVLFESIVPGLPPCQQS